MTGNRQEISRVERPREEAKKFYNKLSKRYDLLSNAFEKKYRKKGLELLNAREGEKILEIGYGTGHCILSLAHEVGDSGEVHGIDISEGMHDISSSRIQKAGLSNRADLIVGDAMDLPYDEGSFDAVFMSFTLELFDTPEIPAVLKECRKILKSNGRISVVAMSKKVRCKWMMRLYEWAHRKFPDYVDCRPIFAGKSLENSGFRIMEQKEMPMWGLLVEVVLAIKPD